MKLRSWQYECVELALQHYSNNQHFLCLATPGAGKTVMAADLSKKLLQQNAIDFILCFAPSLAIVSGIEKTFSHYLEMKFDGRIGAVGGVYTYQGMQALGDEFWFLLESNRVLVVFDEIHHCAGNEFGSANSWGNEILVKIQHKATYTLAMTGTPWRSDKTPIVLASYSDPEGRIICNYTYSLKSAISDKVCRKPTIILVDNERLTLSNDGKNNVYHGLSDLLRRSDICYQHLLQNDRALQYCLSLGCSRLDELRLNSPSAGGLVVASSVSHAEKIANLLKDQFNKTVSLVSYKHKGSGRIIEQFRNSTEEWIVSVGMISEGTDIPRLQVCCHLSRITTEMYFRQVLGRILRTTGTKSNSAWLYTFAEPMLVKFSQRVTEEIPNECLIKFDVSVPNVDIGNDIISLFGSKSRATNHGGEFENLWFDNQPHNLLKQLDNQTSNPFSSYSIEFLGSFRQELIKHFQSDALGEKN